MYQTQLIFVRDGNPDFFDVEKKIINFMKRTMISQIFENIQLKQQKNYMLRKIPFLQNYFDTEFIINIVTDEDVLYKMSKKIEP
jgi:hypothetical protein